MYSNSVFSWCIHAPTLIHLNKKIIVINHCTKRSALTKTNKHKHSYSLRIVSMNLLPAYIMCALRWRKTRMEEEMKEGKKQEILHHIRSTTCMNQIILTKLIGIIYICAFSWLIYCNNCWQKASGHVLH